MVPVFFPILYTRRRRFHQSGPSTDSPTIGSHSRTRRSSFCLYISNHETHHGSVSSLLSNQANQAKEDEKLGGVAREAKERLDERLKTQRKSESRRHDSKNSLRCLEDRSMVLGEVHTEVFVSKKSGSKRFSWLKLRLKSSDQDECAVCLEQFKAGETLMHLPCVHRFHESCLVPWLENNSQCPCCRMEILS
ncbi:zf-RING_2 domain-containing protein [Cephalotus follicularis]|uniref:Zf-RING_2 domain-containing protein n=1 Tax=Cephalotus follicularis TaxID=3775 RepID=A0A1Q3C1A5_CEPFO|nr:zf-RING_2 domain-containing protein [Cephalotus follicularis]